MGIKLTPRQSPALKKLAAEYPEPYDLWQSEESSGEVEFRPLSPVASARRQREAG